MWATQNALAMHQNAAPATQSARLPAVFMQSVSCVSCQACFTRVPTRVYKSQECHARANPKYVCCGCFHKSFIPRLSYQDSLTVLPESVVPRLSYQSESHPNGFDMGSCAASQWGSHAHKNHLSTTVGVDTQII